MKFLRTLASTAAVLATLTAATAAHASLTTAATFAGTYGVSSDGWGSTTQSGTISAFVPVGATVAAAYLYTSTFGTTNGAGGTLAGSTVTYANVPGPATGGINGLQAMRADVTSIVRPLIDGGTTGTYNFRITETSDNQTGSALVVVYSLPSLGFSTVVILDGNANTAGETATAALAQAVNNQAPNFQAELRLGIGYSFNGTPCGNVSPLSTEISSVSVNGTQITSNAGCNDDSADATALSGNLITVGGDDDAFSPSNPSIVQDHERYNIGSLLANGSTSVTINSRNPSGNDNLFLAVLRVTGTTAPGGGEPPEPASLALVGLALAGLAMQQRRSAKRA